MATAQPVARRFERIPGKVPVTLVMEVFGQTYERPAATVDLSKRGIKVQTDEIVLRPGQTCDVFSQGGRWRMGHCRVVWAAAPKSDTPAIAGLEILN